MGLDQIVNVQISRQTQGVTQAGFGVPCIFGPNSPAPQTEMREYTTIGAVAEDFETSDAEYVMAQKLFSQTPRPPRIKIFKTSAAVAQVVTLTPNVANNAEYTVTINGVEYSFTSDADASAAEIVAGLIAEINGDANAKVTASGTSTLILTADDEGVSFTYSSSTNLPGVLTTPNNGIAEDIQKAIDVNNDFYFVMLTATDDETVEVAASTVESLKKMLAFLNSDADVLLAPATDLVSRLKAKNLFRSFVMFTETPADRHDAAFVGRVAPLDPGSETWANKTLANVTVDKYTDGEQANLNAKNANYYIGIAGINVTMNGKVVGGEYIDIIRFIDWLTARMQERIFGDIARLDKIPFTDGGIAIIESDMRAVLEAGVRAGGIASSQDYTITVPKAKDISPADKAARKLTGVKFTAVLSGAIHAVEIQGTVTL